MRLGQSVETPYAWVVVAVSFVLIAVGGAAHYITVVSLKPIAAQFDWPRAIPATGYSLTMLGAGVGGILMGRWSDRIGIHIPVVTGIASIGIGCWLLSRTSGQLTFFLAHGLFLGLLGNAALFGPLLANTTRWFDRRRGIAVGIVAAGQSLAGAVWIPVFGNHAAAHGWRETYLWFGIGVAALLLPLSLLLRRRAPVERPRPAARKTDAGEVRVLGLAPGMVLAMLCAAIVGCCVAMAMPVVHMVAWATDLGFSAVRGAEIISVALACSVVSRIVWGFASDRIGGVLTLFLGSLFQALALLGFTFVTGMSALYVLAAFFGLGYGGIVPAYAMIVRELFPVTGIGTRIGVVLLFGTVGMALGGWLGATIFDLTGSYDNAFLTGLGFNLLNLAVVGTLLHRLRVSREAERVNATRAARSHAQIS